MSKIIGIDLGTTNSVVSVMEGGAPVVISTAEGSELCPSIVAFSKKKERLVGQMAKRQAVVNPENTVHSVKRLMGRRHDEPEAQRTADMVSYAIVAGPQGDARVHVPVVDKTFTPQELSAFILQKLKRDAEAYLGDSVTKAVITVPAYFNDSQRQATKDAGQIAGLEVLRIINEPTAAALAYGLDKKTDQTILVFDLGGGTFDVSVLEVGDGVIEVKSTSGDTHLGGDDWDERLVDWMITAFREDQGINLATDRQAMQRLREAAEKAKIELSSLQETEINLPFITADANGPKHLQMRLSRARFEKLTEALVDRCRAPFTQALKDAGINAGDLDEVVLVGGSTRMPMIQDLVRELTGKEPNKSVNPDQVVALGAAIQGGVLAGDVKDVLLLDVTPLTLGIETLGGVLTPLIPRNTTIPARKSQIFTTAEDGQPGVDVKVLQGERPMAADNMLLGNFMLDGIPTAPRGVPQIEVTFDIDANGILNVSARDRASGKEQSIEITATTNLSEQDVEGLVNDARRHEAEDRRRRELVEARNQADSLVYAAEKRLSELDERLPEVDRRRIESHIQQLRQAMAGEDAAAIRRLTEELEQMSYALGQQAQADSAAANGRDDARSPNDEDIIEGEFEQA